MRREQLTRLAAEGITVLTNHDAVLPLDREQTVALIGRHAVDTICMGGGSAQVNPPYQVSVAEGLSTRLGDRVTVTDGVEVRSRPLPARGGILTDPDTGEPGVRFTLLAEDGTVLEERHATGATTMVGFDDDFDATVATVRFRARINATGPLEVGVIGAGAWDFTVGDRPFQYRLTVGRTGFGEEILAPPAETSRVEATGDDIVDGAVVLRPPSDVATVDVAGSETLEGAVNPLTGVGLFGLVARPAPGDPAAVIRAAAEAAAAADVAVVVVGLTEEQETESVDKSTLHLPGRQDELVEAVAAAARRTVVVVNAATPVIMPWRGRVDAILWAGLPGQEGGHAVAAALLGDIEPGGRLVTTFPAADEQAPAWSVTPVDGKVEYREGPFIGYRGHHAERAPAPAFWFGHGLGYAQWQYGEPRLSADGDDRVVTVTVTNTGTRDSREVVQVYFEPSDTDQPIRLAGWRSVPVPAGRQVTVEVPLDRRLWRRWDDAAGGWGRLSGAGELLVARGLGDVRGSVKVDETG